MIRLNSFDGSFINSTKYQAYNLTGLSKYVKYSGHRKVDDKFFMFGGRSINDNSPFWFVMNADENDYEFFGATMFIPNNNDYYWYLTDTMIVDVKDKKKDS